MFGGRREALARIPDATQDAVLMAKSAQVINVLKSQVTAPFVSWSEDVTECVCKLAMYELYSVHGYNPGNGADVNIRMRYDDSLAWLKSVSKHEIKPTLITAASTEAPTRGGMRIVLGIRRR